MRIKCWILLDSGPKQLIAKMNAFKNICIQHVLNVSFEMSSACCYQHDRGTDVACARR